MVFNVIEALNELGERSKAEAFTDKTAKEVMHRKVVFCRDTDTIKFALELIKDKDFSQLPVLNRSGSVVGTVYQKNLLMAHMNNTENRKKRVSEILDPALPQIDENTPIRKLKSLMEGYDAILVTEKGKLKGIISVFDMLRVL
jgi:predicted transcriptional regulator